jgi:hypothetical protein
MLALVCSALWVTASWPDGHCYGVTFPKGGDGPARADDGPWPRVCDHCGRSERPGDPVQTCAVNGEELSALTPRDRLSVIAASCDDADWPELFELEIYSFIATQDQGVDRESIRRVLHGLVDKVVKQAMGGPP